MESLTRSSRRCSRFLRSAFLALAAVLAAPTGAFASSSWEEGVEWWRETEGERADLATVAEADFQAFPDGFPNLGPCPAPIWLRLRLSHDGHAAVTRIVSVAWPRIGSVEAFTVSESGTTKVLGRSGWDVPWSERPLPGAAHSFPIQLGHGETTVYFRVMSDTELILPVQVSTWIEFLEAERLRSLAGAGYLGVLLALATFNIWIFFRLRQRYHLIYALSVFCFVPWWLLNAGWLSFVAGGPVSFAVIGAVLGAGWHLLRLTFARDFLQLSRVSPKLDGKLALFQWLVVPVLLFGLLFLDTSNRELLLPFFEVPMALFTVVAGFVAYRRGVRMARWFLPATVLLNAGLLLGYIVFSGVILHPLWAGAFIMLGMGGELVVLTLALAERARQVVEQREQVLREATTHRLASLEKLVAGVTHEFNSPLGALRSASDSFDSVSRRLQDGLPDSEDKKMIRAASALEPLAASARAATERLEHVLRSLRTFARLDEASEERVDLSEGIKSALVLLEPETSGNIEVTAFLPELPAVQCRAAELNQAFMAVLTNAVEAMPEGGHLGVRAVADDATIEVEVEDTGGGIPPAAQAHLFEPQLIRNGRRVKMGLGLSTAKGVLDAHDGTIEVSSVLGEGTRVTMRLPRN